jgi:hypothetical protein
MLNELCQLADSMEKVGFAPKEWHPLLKPLPKATEKKQCFKISILEDGNIYSIDKIDLSLVPQLKKWEPNNGSSFPGMNLQALYWLTNEEQIGKITNWKNGKERVDVELLKRWCTDATNKWTTIESGKKSCFIDKLVNCIGVLPSEFLTKIPKNGIAGAGKDVNTLVERVLRYPHVKKLFTTNELLFKHSFREAIEKYLWKKIEEGDSISTTLTFLVGDKKPSDSQSNISVFLDISDWIDFPVANANSIDFINTILIQTDINKENCSNQNDAFGKTLEGNDDVLPTVTLPYVGKVGLRSMNSASSCQYRYGTIDTTSYPIGHESRKRAKGALEWLGGAAREGETWGRADNKELFFAYPSALSATPIKLASCFGARKPDDLESRFANVAKDAILALSGISKDLRSLELRVFSLKKMDPTSSKTKVVFQRNCSAQRLVEAAKDWQEGCANIPEINMRAWGEKKGESVYPNMLTPFPLQIAPCLNRVWKLDGTSKCETFIVNHSHGIELLLEEHPESFVPHILSVALQNCKGLVLSVGCAINRGDAISIKGYYNHALLIPSILGLLLYKLGIRKESYMSNTPFLVGRMLKLADELHALWSKEVREGKLPPQLIGNSLMTAALDSPVQSLAQLALRLKPYYGWAQTTRSEKNAGLARYFVGLYGEVAAELAELKLPARFNDPERAQLLLGYLAANPKKSKDVTETLSKK